MLCSLGWFTTLFLLTGKLCESDQLGIIAAIEVVDGNTTQQNSYYQNGDPVDIIGYFNASSNLSASALPPLTGLIDCYVNQSMFIDAQNITSPFGGYGTYILDTQYFPGGTHLVTLVYSGDSNYSEINISTEVLITPAATTVANVAYDPSPPTVFQPFTINITVRVPARAQGDFTSGHIWAIRRTLRNDQQQLFPDKPDQVNVASNITQAILFNEGDDVNRDYTVILSFNNFTNNSLWGGNLSLIYRYLGNKDFRNVENTSYLEMTRANLTVNFTTPGPFPINNVSNFTLSFLTSPLTSIYANPFSDAGQISFFLDNKTLTSFRTLYDSSTGNINSSALLNLSYPGKVAYPYPRLMVGKNFSANDNYLFQNTTYVLDIRSANTTANLTWNATTRVVHVEIREGLNTSIDGIAGQNVSFYVDSFLEQPNVTLTNITQSSTSNGCPPDMDTPCRDGMTDSEEINLVDGRDHIIHVVYRGVPFNITVNETCVQECRYLTRQQFVLASVVPIGGLLFLVACFLRYRHKKEKREKKEREGKSST